MSAHHHSSSKSKSHDHSHHGHHHHNHIDPNAGDARVFWAIVVNMILTVAQIVGGMVSGSLALIADAIHNLSDAVALIIAFTARKIARRPANEDMPFGFARVEVVAALINYTTLVVIGLYLIYEAVVRFINPQSVDGWLIVIIAGVALVIDLITAALTYSMSKDSINIRAAFLHNVADALGSVAVIVAGTLVILYDWIYVDPIVTLLIAGYILWHTFVEIGPAIRILMLGKPVGIEVTDIFEEIKSVEGVSGAHDLRLWQMQERENALDAHIVLDPKKWSEADAIKLILKERLKDKFQISHSTLELECSAHACEGAETIGYGAFKTDIP
jgi:cobalt-zinc-cadmium efflux system protein